jgi:hypothetical protein
MRFTGEKKLMEAYWNNTEKSITKFLWLPLTIEGETRWLERATVVYRVRREETLFFGRVYEWRPIKFHDL